jgi:O-antigen/teichoic acid export membrane protein
MARPNLTDPNAVAEYRRELRAYLRIWRIIGLAIVICAALWLAFRDRDSGFAWSAFIGGWLMLACIIVFRTRYHRRRMSEPV